MCAALAALVRVPLLWDDPFAPGYDGWYYVLQVRSLQDGAPLFADRSLVFRLLTLLADGLGDVILANKVAACICAATGAAGATIGAVRWTGSLAAGLVAGVWWAVAPGHLVVGMEFLKNAAGVGVLGLLCAALPGMVRTDRSPSAWDLGLGLGLALLGPLVHKVTGVMGLLLVLGAGVVVLSRRLSWSRRQWLLVGGLGAGVLAVGLGWGLVRGVDLERFLAPQPGDGPRLSMLWTSRRIHPVHRLSLLAAHLLPIALAAGLRRTRLAPLGWLWVGLSVLTAAPLLPFGFDLTAWRLLLLAFVPTAFGLALLVARTHAGVGVGLALLALATTFDVVAHTARAEPDYPGWADHVPTLQQQVPPTDRVVAHRGLCGFVWAVADRVCENFDPQGPPDGWWRIVYGMGAARLTPYSSVPPVPLKLGYTLVPEAAWRAFRADHADTLPLVRHPRNPYRPRPGFVYGPEGATPPGSSATSAP